MRKKLCLIMFSLCMFFCLMNRLEAFSIGAAGSVYQNSSVAVTIDATGLIGKFNVTSSDNSVLAGGDSIWIENSQVTLYFTASNVGTATITVTAYDVSDLSGNEYSGSRSTSVSVIKKNTSTPIDINKTYSDNNYLSELGIEGYELDKDFDKETLEYNVTLEPGTSTINVIATKEDDKSNVRGNGEVSVTEGINTIEIVVTAENGNERIYKISVRVDEKDPIEVNVNKSKYTVIKRREVLNKPEGYEETTVKINGFEIPAYYNEITKVTLVGLKDEVGNIKLYSYNPSNGKYLKYNEYAFNKMNLYIHEDLKSKYDSTQIKINDEEVTAYKLKGVKGYYLVYATNTLTGYEGYYLYDTEENSVQRYNTALLDKVTSEKDKYFSIVLVMSCVCFLTMLFLLIEVNRDSKRKN